MCIYILFFSLTKQEENTSKRWIHLPRMTPYCHAAVGGGGEGNTGYYMPHRRQ